MLFKTMLMMMTTMNAYAKRWWQRLVITVTITVTL